MPAVSEESEHEVFLIARSPLGPGAPFDVARQMLASLDRFVSGSEVVLQGEVVYMPLTMRATDPVTAAAAAAGRLQENLDVWEHFDVRKFVPATPPGPSALFEYH